MSVLDEKLGFESEVGTEFWSVRLGRMLLHVFFLVSGIICICRRGVGIWQHALNPKL